MPKKFIVHIGPAKTGTSSLQEALYENREILLEHGYDFPGFGRHAEMQKLPGHHGIPDRLRRLGEVPQGVLDHLAQLPDDRTYVFSSENFAHVSEEGVRILLDGLGVETVQVVHYARRWDHLLPSVWQELIKHGDSRPYLTFLNAQMTAPLASPYLNYASVLDPWAKVVGKDNLRLFSYDNVQSSGQGIVAHFSQTVLGITLDVEAEHRQNPRQKIGFTETVRMLNRLAFGGRTGTPEIRFALMQAREAMAEELAELEALYAPYEQQARLCAPFVFAHVERDFLRKYGDQVENLSDNGRLFGDLTLEPASYINQDYLLEKGAVDKLHALLKKIR